MNDSVELKLPWPMIGRRANLGTLERIDGLLSVCILAFPPDNQPHRLSDLAAPTLDALQHAGLYESDSQIDLLLIRRGNVRPGGELFVIVRTKMEELPL